MYPRLGKLFPWDLSLHERSPRDMESDMFTTESSIVHPLRLQVHVWSQSLQPSVATEWQPVPHEAEECLAVFVVVQSLSHVWLFATPWTDHSSPLSFTVSWSFLKFMSTESVMLSKHLILCLPLLLWLSEFASWALPKFLIHKTVRSNDIIVSNY